MTEYLNAFPGKVVVSVGSGNGTYEYELMKSGIEIICVDPAPESYLEYPSDDKYIKPHYSLVDDLIKSQPQLVSNCVLFLNWPAPLKSTYDIESIEKLKPLGIVIVYETLIKAAGGNRLHEWLDSADNGDYYEIASYKLNTYRMWTEVILCLKLLVHMSYRGLAKHVESEFIIDKDF
jgi:hypothetical protein